MSRLARTFRRNATIGGIASLLGSTALVLGAAPVGASPHSSNHSIDVIADSSFRSTLSALAPAFTRATGYSLVLTTGSSSGDATEIKSRSTTQDVFISAGATAQGSLSGTKNGNWVTWYAQFANTPLLLGYSAKSKFAHDLLTMPWYKVVTLPGFHIGRTSPTTDEQDVLADTALNFYAAKPYKLTALKTLATESSDVYTESSLIGGLRSGHIDAGFLFGDEASAAKIATVTLGAMRLTGSYQISILSHAPHLTGAEAFIKWLLGATTSSALQSDGFILNSPAVLAGHKSAVPTSLQSLVS